MLHNVSKKFGDVEVITDFNMKVPQGELVVLLGSSGSGKSTLLRMIAGLTPVSGGDIIFGDRRVNKQSPRERDVAFMFQNYALYPQWSVRENIAYPLIIDAFKGWYHLPGISSVARRTLARSAAIRAKVDEIATLLDLEPYLDRKPGALSGGQRQRVALARALVRDPALFLFDEPLSNLDAKLRSELRTEITRLHRDTGKTFIYVTHDQVEAMTMGTRVVLLHNGVVQQFDTPEGIYERPNNTYVARFLGSPPMNLLAGTAHGDALVIGATELGLPAPVRTGAVVMGFRPENVELVDPSEGGALLATVRRIEDIGADSLVGLDLDEAVEARLRELNGGRLVWAKLAGRTDLAVGDRCALRVPITAAHWFDHGSGVRLDAAVLVS